MGRNAAVNAARLRPALQNRLVPVRLRQGFLPQRSDGLTAGSQAVVDEVEVAALVSCACSLMSCSSRFDCALFDVLLLVELSVFEDAAVVMLTFDPSA
jgi:hypothetical protein